MTVIKKFGKFTLTVPEEDTVWLCINDVEDWFCLYEAEDDDTVETIIEKLWEYRLDNNDGPPYTEHYRERYKQRLAEIIPWRLEEYRKQQAEDEAEQARERAIDLAAKEQEEAESLAGAEEIALHVIRDRHDKQYFDDKILRLGPHGLYVYDVAKLSEVPDSDWLSYYVVSSRPQKPEQILALYHTEFPEELEEDDELEEPEALEKALRFD